MQIELSDIISLLALLISILVAYKTLIARFNGRVWPVNALALTKISIEEKDNIPCIGMACFMENRGARPGRLDRMRIKVHNKQYESDHTFYAYWIRNDYRIFSSYQDSDWFPFGGIALFPDKKVQQYYVVFKPVDANFQPVAGDYTISMQVRWMSSNKYITIPPTIKLNLSQSDIQEWRSPTAQTKQILLSTEN